MHARVSWFTKARFFTSAGLLYATSAACIVISLRVPPARAAAPQSIIRNQGNRTAATHAKVLAADGRPIRIVIPSRKIDLKIIPGSFNASTDSWTLSGYNAQFDTASNPANNAGGLTFIYGHNNNFVFGALRHSSPAPGAQALIYTDNSRIFSYAFDKSWSVSPDDVATLDYQGPPVLLIQTCTGSLNEWRTMYLFHFVKVLK